MEVHIAIVKSAKVCLEANQFGLEASEDLGVFAYHTSFHSYWVYLKRVEVHCQVWNTPIGHDSFYNLQSIN
jgi:hypothetical protein